MALEALSSNEFLNFIIYDTISATPYSSQQSEEQSIFMLQNAMKNQECGTNSFLNGCLPMAQRRRSSMKALEPADRKPQTLSAVQGRKKRRRKPRVCKNKEEAETQRMTHIAVERNRRKQMNEHLAVLRSLMPESFAQRGDQASIVGGAIEFVKELEHLLQSLEARKLQLLQGLGPGTNEDNNTSASNEILPSPFSQFFVHPQYNWSQLPDKYTPKTQAAIADIEVTLIETHANLRILSRRSPRQLQKLVAGFQTLCLTILHINVTTMDPLVLYSISAKVEEGCQLTSVDDIAGAVHHMLRIIEEEAGLC